MYNTLRLVRISLVVSVSNKEFNFFFSGTLFYNINGNFLPCLHILIKTLKGSRKFAKVKQNLDFFHLEFA